MEAGEADAEYEDEAEEAEDEEGGKTRTVAQVRAPLAACAVPCSPPAALLAAHGLQAAISACCRSARGAAAAGEHG